MTAFRLPHLDLDAVHGKRPETVRASVLVRALEDAWREIQERHDALPDVVIVVGPVSKAGKLTKWGHYAGQRWAADGTPRAEVLISAEGLSRGPRAVFETLLHESVHAYAESKGIQDTSRGGRYHNKRFASLADSFGLVVKKNPSIGYITPDVTDWAADEYRDAIVGIDRALRVSRTLEPKGPEGPSRNGVVLVCGCNRKVRASTSTAESGPILCGNCREEFLPEGAPRALPGDDEMAAWLSKAAEAVS